MEILRHLLDREGIATRVFNENTAAVSGEIPFFSAMPELWIESDEDAHRARDIVARFESGKLSRPRGGAPWRCPPCDSLIEAQFTDCWNCSLGNEPDPRGDEIV